MSSLQLETGCKLCRLSTNTLRIHKWPWNRHKIHKEEWIYNTIMILITSLFNNNNSTNNYSCNNNLINPNMVIISIKVRKNQMWWINFKSTNLWLWMKISSLTRGNHPIIHKAITLIIIINPRQIMGFFNKFIFKGAYLRDILTV